MISLTEVQRHALFKYHSRNVADRVMTGTNKNGVPISMSCYEIGIVFYTQHILLKVVGVSGEETMQCPY